MMQKIYLIGKISDPIDEACENKFYKTQLQLSQIGFNVFNPLERLTAKDLSFDLAYKKNLQDLMFCDAVYIMPCFSFDDAKHNLELKCAINFNLLFINGFVDITSSQKGLKAEKKQKRRTSVK